MTESPMWSNNDFLIFWLYQDVSLSSNFLVPWIVSRGCSKIIQEITINTSHSGSHCNQASESPAASLRWNVKRMDTGKFAEELIKDVDRMESQVHDVEIQLN